MHACVRAEDKMRGYFHWLWVRAKRVEQPLPLSEPRSEEELRRRGQLLEGGAEPRVEILDVLAVRSWFFLTGLPEEAFLGAEEVHSAAELLVVREADGTRTLA